ncbi:PIN domain-containing protein [Halanaerobium kushneri]|nr:hypothetical protein [Halanaerobium kushneri]
MTWTSDTGNTYKLCLLDTNAVSEIIKNPKREGRGFITRFPPGKFVPCITIYNLIELRRKVEIFDKFLNFFSLYPFFLLKPFQFLLAEELLNYDTNKKVSALFNSFSPLGRDSSYKLRKFVENMFKINEIKSIEKNWRDEERETLKTWLSFKDNFKPTKSDANSKDAERYIKEAGSQTLIRLKPNWIRNRIINEKREIKFNRLASLKVMLYSQYYRLYDPYWKPEPQEVTDVTIFAAAPYVDSIITEKFQANIFDKINNKVPKLNNMEVFRLNHIRY